MADYQLPNTSKYFGSTGPDQVQFLMGGHTAALPRLAIFKRRQSNGKPTSEYNVMLVFASADSLGVVRNTLIEFRLRNVVSQDPAVVFASLDFLGDMLKNDDFQNDCVTELLLPAPNAIAA